MDHGYDVLFTSEIESRFQCPICLLILRNAVQTACGHRFCDACIKKVILSKNSILTCPVDKTFSKVDEIFPDIATRREILSLPVKCANTDCCSWQGELRELQAHQSTCSMEKVVCPQSCGVKIRRSEVEKHLTLCPSRPVHCPYCGDRILHSKMVGHTEQCPKCPVTCSMCGDKQLREELGRHLDPDHGSCPKVITSCPFKFSGCQFKAERSRVEEHAKDPVTLCQHLNQAGLKLAECCKTIDELKGKVTELSSKTNEAFSIIGANQRSTTQMARELKERNVTGKLHWKVKVGQLRNPRTSYCSPAFYTGCPGYKVQLTLDMDGVREGNVRYTSLSVTLQPGEYDDDVVFPFNATCYVTLYDQANTASQRVNLTQEIVLREVPRNHNRGGQAGERIYRREHGKYVKRNELLGNNSRYLRHGFLHFEVTIIHSFYPPPEAAAAYMSSACISNLMGQGALIIHTPQRNPVTRQAALPAQPPIMGLATLAIGN
ncbi:TNF receptor-associated factor 6-like [Physella acuta]|uniref:TNF receptor-associated factor 6-like n=1 Tax=Physella acuta TaxID=109671 RepID=UPI0027DB4A4D|nr:TNF receptor-associated factor 6-like [Physella acuta]